MSSIGCIYWSRSSRLIVTLTVATRKATPSSPWSSEKNQSKNHDDNHDHGVIPLKLFHALRETKAP